MRVLTIYWRALRLRCPLCGRGKLFHGFAMHETCPECGGDFRREPGFYLGSIYFNYGLTAGIVAVAYPLLLFTGVLTNDQLFWGALVFVVLMPVLLFRHARAWWLAFDQIWDPKPGEVGTGKAAKDSVKL